MTQCRYELFEFLTGSMILGNKNSSKFLHLLAVYGIQSENTWSLPYYKVRTKPKEKLFCVCTWCSNTRFQLSGPAPSVPSLISIESVELLCRASNISTTNPFCFVKQNRKRLKLSCNFYLQISAELKFTPIKAATQP